MKKKQESVLFRLGWAIIIFSISSIITAVTANLTFLIHSFGVLPRTALYFLKSLLFFTAVLLAQKKNTSGYLYWMFVASSFIIDMTVFINGLKLIPLRFPFATLFSLFGIFIAHLYVNKRKWLLLACISFLSFTFLSHYFFVPAIIRYMEKKEGKGIKYLSPMQTGKLFTVDSTSIYLGDTLKGKCILIEYYFVGCPPCERKMRYLKKIKNDINTNEFEIILICSGEITPFNIFKEDALKHKEFTFSFFYDRFNIKESFMPGKEYPHEIIVDKKGKVHSYKIGFNNETANFYLSENYQTIRSILDN